VPVPTDPVVLILLAVVLWAFWMSCVLRDRMTADRGGSPRRVSQPASVGTSETRRDDA
jgi:hypothetical protein